MRKFVIIYSRCNLIGAAHVFEIAVLVPCDKDKGGEHCVEVTLESSFMLQYYSYRMIHCASE